MTFLEIALDFSLIQWWQKLIGTTTGAPLCSIAKQEQQEATRATTKPSHKRRRLPIQVYQQQFSYSCVASVLQMVFRYVTDEHMSHARAVRLVRCKPNGAELVRIPQTMFNLCGAGSRKLRSSDHVRAAIKVGLPVICSDETSYEDSHAALVIGQSPTGFCIADPATGKARWRTSEWLTNSDEFLVVLPKDDQRSEALMKIIRKRRRTRTHYYAPPIRIRSSAGDGRPRLPVATIRLRA
jgi:hypothetical protein